MSSPTAKRRRTNEGSSATTATVWVAPRAALDALSSPVMNLIVCFLGSFAPSTSRLAEVNSACSFRVRSCYCRHCGRIMAPGTRREVNQSTGRAAHGTACKYPIELDPFRWVYSTIDWQASFVAGGYAAFLHWNEHLRYDNPWRSGGELQQRDIDIFYYNTGGYGHHAHHWYRDMMGQNSALEIIKVVEKSSRWDEKMGRLISPETASMAIQIHPAGRDTPVLIVNPIFKNHKAPSTMAVLESFDLPCTMVGFTLWKPNDAAIKATDEWLLFDNKQTWVREWILHPSHTQQDLTALPDDLKWARLHKYLKRGYHIGGNGAADRVLLTSIDTPTNRCDCLRWV